MSTLASSEKEHGLREEDSKGRRRQVVSDGSVDIYGKASLKGSSGGWKACSFVYGMTTLEICVFVGLGFNMVPYLTRTMMFAEAAAATTYTNMAGTSYLLTLVTAFIADTCLGRFWTVILFGLVEFSGVLAFALSSIIRELKPAPCARTDGTECSHPSPLHLVVLYLALYLLAVGGAGVRPNLPSHGADQFNREDPDEARAQSGFFNWFFGFLSVGVCMGVGALVSITTGVGNEVGFLVAAGVLLTGVLCFASGAFFYRHKKPNGSPLTRIAQVLVAATRNKLITSPRSRVSRNPACDLDDYAQLFELSDEDAALRGVRRIPHTAQLQFLDRAARIEACIGATEVKVGKIMQSECLEIYRSKWRLCTVTQVEEAKAVIKVLPIWATTIMLNTCVAQLQTLSIAQGVSMNRKIGQHIILPAPALVVIPALTNMCLVPIYDQVFVKIMRRFTGHPQGISSLRRIGTGLFISVLSMVVAALVEGRRLRVAINHGLVHDKFPQVPYSIFWLLPQYLIFGVADLFSTTGSLEFFYSQAPDSMRSMSSALAYTALSLGFFFSTILVNTVNMITSHHGKQGWIAEKINESKLNDFYWLLSVLGVVNWGLYLKCAQWYTYRPVAADPIAVGRKELRGTQIDDMESSKL